MYLSIIVRASKDLARIRFRFSERGKRYFLGTDIKLPVAELREKYNCTDGDKTFFCDGRLKKGISRYNATWYKQIQDAMEIARKAWEKCIAEDVEPSNDILKRFADEIKYPELAERHKHPLVMECWEKYKMSKEAEELGQRRKYYYTNLGESLWHYLVLIKKDENMRLDKFSHDDVMALQKFMFDEPNYQEEHPELFHGCRRLQKRNSNTIAGRMKTYKAFFDAMVSKHYITESPFDALSKNAKREMMREEYDEPIFLEVDELMQVMETEVDEDMQVVKDIFVCNCMLGCRISELASLSRDDLHVEDGIPYFAYLPTKTLRTARTTRGLIKTPLMRPVFDIMAKYGFSLPLDNVSGKDGYNKRLKVLLKQCMIVRKVFVSDNGKVEARMICDVASSKIARKTFVEAMQQVQIDEYASGLHKRGSDAVEHYGIATRLVRNKFVLMCTAFGQVPYRVNDKLKYIE